MAEKIASITSADTYEIKASQEYTDADLDWHDDNSRSTLEQNDASARPEIGSDPVSLDGYKTIYQTVREYSCLHAVGSGMNRTPLNKNTVYIRSLQARPP